MTATALKSALLPAFLAGAARRRPDLAPVPGLSDGDAKADLKAAAVLAQALRLERPPAPDHFVVEPAATGSRPPLPEALREPFLRLFGAGKLALPPQDPLAAGMALALERLFIAPHPHDFHRLDGFLRAHGERLGADVQAWLDRDRQGEAPRGYFDVDVLTDETWTEATPARRERYVAERRLADPAAARALVEGVWPREPSDLRQRLLGALRVRLGSDDRPFLESLAKDRAPKVRELAESLLAHLPGPDGERPAQREALGRIAKATTGMFRKRTVLTLELPATVAKPLWLPWVITTFADLDIEPCVERLGLTPGEAIEAAGDSTPLLAAFTLMAACSRRLDLVAEIGRRSQAPLLVLTAGGFSRGPEPVPADALALAAALVPAQASWTDMPLAPVLAQLHALARQPVEAAVFDAIAAEVGRRQAQEDEAAQRALLSPLALLAPGSRRPQVRAFAARFADGGGSVTPWLDCLDHLEKASSHE